MVCESYLHKAVILKNVKCNEKRMFNVISKREAFLSQFDTMLYLKACFLPTR